MAQAIVSGVLKNLGELISTPAKEKFDLLTGLETEIHNLSNTLKRIQAVLDDAEKKKFKDKIVELWLHNLEDISYEIDDVIDEWNYLIRKEEIEGPSWLTRVCSFIPFSCFFKVRFVRPDIAVNVKKLNERLDSIEREQNQFRFITSSAIASSSQEFKRVQSTSLLNVSQVIGRDSEKETLVSQLLYERHEEEKNIIKVLSIVGTGGIGKTTLAQLAYNDARVNGQFEKKGWVCVSDTFDEIRVAKAIVESLESSQVQNLGELDSLLQLVKKSTSGKRFLLVLDDVWLEDQMVWEPFKNSLNYGAPGSRILLTTRKKTVATNAGAISMIDLDIMSPSDSWSLFHQIAFVGPNATGCERLENMGKEIAEKCKGLPLAIKVIASFLSSKNVEYWLNVKDSELWKLKVTNVEIFPHLYLSYNDLSPVLRRCFSYCAVFRKGQLIRVDDLIGSWIKQGYLESSEIEDEMEVEGREYFEILASRLFFVQCTKYNDGRIMSCRMHDMVHDFALHLTKRELLVIEGSKVVTFCEKPRHVIWLRDYRKAIDTLPECNMGQARSFVRESFSSATLETVATKSLMNSLKLVRLLDLSGCDLELPTEIGNLIHLRYLSLSWNNRLKELPATVYNLYNLHTLKLNGCDRLRELPPGIEKLKKLRHLIVGRVKFPMGIEELTCLQTLPYFLIGREYNKLGHLKNLNQLRGSLVVWIMDDLKDAKDAQNADLKSKKHIQNLEFRIENSSRVTKDVMKALEPHPKLQKLKFYYYGETELPPWMTSLNDLVELGLYYCTRLTALPPLGILPSLETLHIDTQPRSKFEDCAFWARRESFPSPAMAFPKLKVLQFGHGYFSDSNCKEEAEWEKWEAHEPPLNLQILTFKRYGRSQLPMWMTSLNNLKKLSLNDCFNLISLLPLGILPSLERLEFCECEQLKFVGAAFLGIRESLPSPAIGFPKLEELAFYCCESLEEWEDISAEDVEDNTVSLMPCLQWLIIDDCPNLQTLPHQLLQKASSLSCIMLDEEEYNPSIFLLIASTLAEVKAREPNHQSTSTEEGPQVKPIHPALHPLIYSNDEGVLKDACLALSYFLSDSTYDKAMIEAGVCQGIAELLRHRSPHVLIPALDVLENILSKNDALIQCIIDTDILPRLLSLLTKNSEESSSNMNAREKVTIQFDATQALRIIAPRILEKRKVLIDLGVVPILVKLLRAPTNDVREQCIIDNDILPRLLSLLTNNSEESCSNMTVREREKILFVAGQALRIIASRTSEKGKMLIDLGVVPILVKLFCFPTDDVRQQAVWTLGTIAGDTPECRDLVLGHGALMPLLLQLNDHATLPMQINATWTLCEFLKHKSKPKFEQVKPALPVLQHLIYSNDEILLKNACSALFFLFDDTDFETQIVIEAGTCQRLVELLHHPSPSVLHIAMLTISSIVRRDRLQTQFVAGQALRIIASRTSEKGKMLIDLGVVPILVKLFCFPTDNVRQQAVLTLGTIAGDTPECRDLVLGHGALMPLLLQLNDHATLPMQINATWTLCEFLKHKSKPKFEQVKPALPVLQDLIYSNDEILLKNACFALFFLFDDTDNETKIVIEASTCQRLVELLHHPSPSVLHNALLTVRNIVRRDRLQTQCIIDHGALPFLMSLLTNNHESLIKNRACWIISSITAQSRDQIQVVIEAGLIAPLVNLLQTAEYNIKNGAAWAISNAICSGTHEQIKFMASEVCIKSLCDHLVCPHPWPIITCLCGLENILKVGEVEKNMGSFGDVNYFAQLIEKAEGLEKIKNLQIHDNNKVHEMATKILQTYWLGDEDETLP